MGASPAEWFTIAEFAKQVGVSTKVIRFYEDRGVLPRPRRSRAGYRLYMKRDGERVRFVRALQSAGFSLREIAVVVSARDRKRHARPAIEALHEARSRVEERIAVLEALRDELGALLDDATESG